MGRNIKKTSKATSKPTSPKKRKPKITPSRAKDQSKYFFFMNNPVSKTYLDDLAEEMINWAEKNKAETAYKAFLVEKKIPAGAFKEWINHKNGKKLKFALSVVKLMIGVTREKGINQGQLNFNAIKLTQYLYDEDFDNSQIREAKIKAEYHDKEKAETKIIIMDSFQLKKVTNET